MKGGAELAPLKSESKEKEAGARESVRNYVLAESVRQVVEGKHLLARAIIDREKLLTKETVDAVINLSTFGLTGRKSRRGVRKDGALKEASDLDLLTFLVTLRDRGAVIEIPQYGNMRATRVKESERKVGQNQFGKITGLVSNQKAFSFSVQIWDNTIVVTNENGNESIGTHRNYALVGLDGEIRPEWSELNFNPDVAENAFLQDNDLLVGSTLYFKYAVHPNRYQSFWGAPYLLLKLLLERLDEEATWLRQEVKRLEGLGFSKSEFGVEDSSGYSRKKHGEIEKVGTTQKVQVPTLLAELRHNLWQGTSEDFGRTLPRRDSNTRAHQAYGRQKLLTYSWKPAVQFVARANELAYFLYGEEGKQRPHWAKELAIETNYREPKKRTDWNRIALAQDFALLYRVMNVTQEVAVE